MLSLALETALGVSCNIRPVTGIWMRLSQDFQKKKQQKIQEPLILPHFHCFLVYLCLCTCARVCVAAPDLAALQTSTDVSGGPVGSHSIEEAPGSSEAFSLPLGSVWTAQQHPLFSPFPPSTLPTSPEAQASAKTTKVPLLLAALSAPPPPSFSQNPRPASISRRYSIHRRRALITKQDYGPCLGTTCQGACSLSCSLSTTHTHFRDGGLFVRVCFFLFFCFFLGGREMEIWLPRMETQSKITVRSFQICLSLLHDLVTHIWGVHHQWISGMSIYNHANPILPNTCWV